MMKKALLLLAILTLIVSTNAEKAFEGKAIWVHPQEMGNSEEEVKAFFELLDRCHINIVFPLVKGTGGYIFWQSQKFRDAIHPDYKDFDLLLAATKFAAKFQIKIHPWICDFPESKNSPAYKNHPEWVMLSPEGGDTSQERLSQDRSYNLVWMCPVRRPGYADQWLIPMIEEIVKNYKVDGIHHDYVRYPGDVAPDSYCFCDYCLEHYLDYNRFYYPSRPEDQIFLKKVLPREEANWHYDITLKPPDWSKMSRKEKADYLLNGKSINRNDLDYYFYETRCDAITRFIQESTEKAREINPKIEVSAAVFINPMRSGRNIGQRWTDFARWLDIIAPMNYRSHFQGSFDDYLTYLTDYIQAQLQWSKGRPLYPGITGHYIYKEEREGWDKTITILNSERSNLQREELKNLMVKNIAYLRKFSTQGADELSEKFKSYLKNKITKDILVEEIIKILRDPPPQFFPEEKLLRTLQTVKKAGAKGVSIFSAGIIKRNKLWSALEKAFSD